MQEAKPVTKKRIEWIDYAKGIGILAVVALHILNGLVNAGIVTDPTTLRFAESWTFYSFNMPVFFFLSGLFIVRSVQKPLSEFFDDRLRQTVYPYFLWSLIMLAVGSLLVGQTNSGAALSPSTFLQLFYAPVFQYWFLYALFFIVMAVAIMSKFKISMYWFFALSVGLFLFGEVVNLYEFSYVLWRLLDFIIFFSIGAVFSQPIRDYIANLSDRNVILWAIGTWAIWIGFIIAGPNIALAWLQPLIIGLGAVGVIMLCVMLDRRNALDIVRHWGVLSLEIFLVHVLAGAGFRIVFQNFLGVDDAALHFVGGTVAGMYFPILLAYAVEKIGFKYTFHIPKAKPKRDASKDAVEAATA